MALVVQQPIPVRLIVGSAYLMLYPIPFWVGFQLESAYQLFKSFNAVFFYALIPLLILAGRRILRERDVRTPAVRFLVMVSAGLTLAVAGTSLETRHFGAFLVPVFLLALIPKLESQRDRRAYLRVLVGFLGGIFALHSLWWVLRHAAA